MKKPSRKPPLTSEEIRIAAMIKAKIASDPNLTEEIVGNAVGVTQGQISHWSGARLPVPAKRAAALAKALGFDDPGILSPAFRKLQSQAVRETPGHYDAAAQALADLRREVDALRAMVVTVMTIAAIHRPIEAADVAKRLRKHLHPALVKETTVAETLKTIEQLVTRSAPPKKAGAADR